MVPKTAAFEGAMATGTPGWTKRESDQQASDNEDDSKDSAGLSFLDIFDCRPVAAKLATGVMTAGLAAVRNSLPEQSAGDTAGGAEMPKLQSKLAVIELAKKHFSKFDADGNGFMTPGELARQVENHEVKGAVAQTVSMLYGLDTRLDLSRDDDSPFLIGFAGISMADLNKAEEVIKDKQRNAANNPASAEFLEAADLNGNGKLSEDELKSAAGKSDLPKDVKKLLDYFASNQDPMDEVEITDILHFYFKKKIGDKTDRLLSRMDFLIRKTWENQVEDPTLYAEGKDNSISMYGVQQGIIGDCYFVASLAAVAQMSPETIKQMIVDNKNGTYTVTFPGAKNEPITVTAPTEAERGLYNGSSEYGVWASVLEKAYGAYCRKDFTRRTPLNWTGGLTTVEGADGGGIFLGKLMRLLTGEDTDSDLQWVTRKSVTKSKLMEHVGGQDKVPVVAWQKPFRNYGLATVTNHVYSVIDYDPEGEDGGTVTLYNPWGHKEDITFKQFRRRFMSVTYRDR